MRYTVILSRDPDGSAINAHVPAMPGIFTWSDTDDEALAAAHEAIELYLEQCVERGQPFPPDRSPIAHWALKVKEPLARRLGLRRITKRMYKVDVSLSASRLPA